MLSRATAWHWLKSSLDSIEKAFPIRSTDAFLKLVSSFLREIKWPFKLRKHSGEGFKNNYNMLHGEGVFLIEKWLTPVENLALEQRGNHRTEFHLLSMDFGSMRPDRVVSNSRQQCRRGHMNSPPERPRTPFACNLPGLSETTCHLKLNFSTVACGSLGTWQYFQCNNIH